jgi:hypothetical protein
VIDHQNVASFNRASKRCGQRESKDQQQASHGVRCKPSPKWKVKPPVLHVSSAMRW